MWVLTLGDEIQKRKDLSLVVGDTSRVPPELPPNLVGEELRDLDT